MRKDRRALWALLLIYAVIMAVLLFWRTPLAERAWNLTPLRSIRSYLRLLGGAPQTALQRYAWINFVGNILVGSCCRRCLSRRGALACSCSP